MGLLDALDPSPFGLNIHTADELLPVFTGIGIRWFRIDANWHEIEPEQGQFDWSPIDRMLDAAEEAGASVLASVAYTPPWASAEARRAGLPDAAWPGLPPVDPESFVRFVQAFTERYAIRLAAISIWNEPDHEKFWRGSQDEHVALLVPALRKVRAVAPDLVTCGPDLSSWSRASWSDFLKARPCRQWMERILRETGCGTSASLLDVVSHHQYGGGDTPAGRVSLIEDLAAFLRQRCERMPPLWITETGFASDKVTLRQQAEYLTATMEAMAARREWWTKSFWYDSHGREDGRAEWGLLGPADAPDERQPRAAFAAYRELITAAGGTPPISRTAALRTVRLAYSAILGRDADPGGAQAHSRQLQATGSIEGLCATLLGSDEFVQRRHEFELEAVAAHCLKVLRGEQPSDDERRRLAEAICSDQAAAALAALLRERAA